MKRILIVFSVCLAFACTGLAQGNSADAPATKEDIQRYLDAMHSHEMMQNMITAMSKPMHQMIHDQIDKNKDKLPADFEARMDKMMDDWLKDMPFDQMMQAEIPVYQKHFTKGDIDSLVVFYNSPTGQKMLKEMPQVLAESMQSMMPIMQDYMEKIKQRAQQEVADMLKNGEKKTTGSPAT